MIETRLWRKISGLVTARETVTRNTRGRRLIKEVQVNEVFGDVSRKQQYEAVAGSQGRCIRIESAAVLSLEALQEHPIISE